MKYYSITGTIDGEAWHGCYQAESMREAVDMFHRKAVQDYCDFNGFDNDGDIFPNILTCVTTAEKPETWGAPYGIF